MKSDRHNLSKSEVREELPIACSNELAAVEFFEDMRWDGLPVCAHCGRSSVYTMMDASGEKRSARFLWRCRECKKQYTVRIGTVYEETRLDLRHWCYAFWRAATSKRGVTALEIMRHCQISYKSALFLMSRIRFAMAPDADTPKLMGDLECDETYFGAKPRRGDGKHHQRGTSEKTPVFAAERGRDIRRVIENVTAKTLKKAMREEIGMRSRIITDELNAYVKIGKKLECGHDTVCHSTGEYAREDVHVNTAESSFANR